MHSSLLEPAAHPSADLGLESCHHRSWADPKPRLTHQPGSQQMPAELLEPAAHHSADLGLRAVSTEVWHAPCDNSVTSRAKQGKKCFGCRQLCLQDNSRQMVSVFKSRSLQRYCRIQHVMVSSHKPQESALKAFLCQKLQVPYFGGLRNRKHLTAPTWQSYSDLKHVSRNSNGRYRPVSTISPFFEPNCTTFEHWNKLPRPARHFKPTGMMENCLSKRYDKQSPIMSSLDLPVSEVV